MPDDTPAQTNEQLDKANYYRKWGGLISYLMKEVDGVRDLVNEELVRKKVPAQEFINVLKMKFPDLPDEKIPSKTAVIEFTKKLREDKDPQSMALALKDEFRILRVLTDFNLFEERMGIYKKAGETVTAAQKALQKALSFMEGQKDPKTGKVINMPLPPTALFEAVTKLNSALDAQSKHLAEIDDLALRFGLMPPKQERNILFAQQNITISNEQQEAIKALGLTADDFSDEKYQATANKILNYYVTKSTKQRPSVFGEAEVPNADEEGAGRGKEDGVVEGLPAVGEG